MPNNYLSYSNRGLAYYRLRKLEQAINDFNKALEINPKSSVAYSGRGLVYRDLENLEQAFDDFNKALELDPKSLIAYISRGVAYGEIGKYELAINDYSKAIEIDPNEIVAFLNIIECRIINDQYKTALELLPKLREKTTKSEFKFAALYIECIAKKINNQDTSSVDKELDSLSKETFFTHWTFGLIESWVATSGLPVDSKKYIKEKTEMFKKHEEQNKEK